MTDRAMGLLVLSSDETLEQDMRHLLPSAGLPIHSARVRTADTVSNDTLGAMAKTLTPAAQDLPQAPAYAVIGYGCTSATAVMGSAKVAELIQAGRPAAAVTTPLDGLLAACKTLGLARIGLVSPYVPSVTETLRAALGQAGVSTPQQICFNEPSEPAVARLPFETTAQAARDLAARGGIDGLFLSCTNLRTLPLIAPLEAELGLPVLSSNLVLAWHMRHLVGQPVGDRPSDLTRS